MVFYQVSMKRKDSSNNFWGCSQSEDYAGGAVFWSSQPPLDVLHTLLSCSQVVLGTGSVLTEDVTGRVKPGRFMGLSAGQTVVRFSNLRNRSLMVVVHFSVRGKCGVQVRRLLQDQSDDVGGRVDLGRLVELAKDGEVARSLDPCNSRLVH